MKLLFILNPVAGKKQTRDSVPIIKEFCRKRSIACDIVESRSPGDATLIARENAPSYDGIVAIGGDGTVLEVANGLFGTGVPLGILPLGSGNDFARALNIPVGIQNISEALKIIADMSPVQVDAARFNDRIYLNVASVGFDAEIVRDLPRVRRFIRGSAAYPVSVFVKFLTYKPKDATLIIDGQELKARVFLAAICNGTCYGGGMRVNPEGSVSDGYLDLILIRPVPRYKVPLLLSRFIKGQHLSLPYVSTYRCKEIEIVSNESLVVNVDGECAATTPICFSSAPLSIKVFGALKQEEK